MKFNRLLLREAAKKIAILNGMPEKAPSEESSVANWERIFHSLTSQGWSLGWIRCIHKDMLIWKIEASKDRIRHVVQGEDITIALIELSRSIAFTSKP